jgi:hypothetical protein
MKIRALCRTSAVFFFCWFLCSATAAEEVNPVSMTGEFIRRISPTHPIRRDAYLGLYANSIVQGRGTVLLSDQKGRYKRKYRLVLEEGETRSYRIRIIYNVFLENEDTISMISAGAVFEFRGQLMTCTPLNTSRNAYVLDIVLQEGALVLQ